MLSAELVAVLQEGEERDVQDQLVELLQYDNFPLIKQLLRNRTTIVWCQRLARAQNDSDRSRIEVRLLPEKGQLAQGPRASLTVGWSQHTATSRSSSCCATARPSCGAIA